MRLAAAWSRGLSSHAQDDSEFRENVHEFAKTVVAPQAEHVDKSNNFPTQVDLWQQMGEFGLLGSITLTAVSLDFKYYVPVAQACPVWLGAIHGFLWLGTDNHA